MVMSNHEIFDQPASDFPEVKEEVIGGKTLKKKAWWVATLLIEAEYEGEKEIEVRMYKWRKIDDEWKYRGNYRFGDTEYLPDLINVLRKFSTRNNKYSLLNSESIERGEKLSEQLEQKEQEIQSLREEVDELRNQNEKSRQIREKLENEIEEKRRSNIDELENAVDKLSKMVENPSNYDEDDFQEHLGENPWFFGTKYFDASREEPAGYDGRVDIFLQDRSGYNDVAELKLPTHSLFTKKGEMIAKLKNTLSQVADYLDYYRNSRYNYREQTGYDIYYPEAYIVIGRKDEDENTKELIKKHESVIESHIKILTYDDLIERGEEAIDILKSDE